MRSLFDPPPALTDAQVAALAKPGESWEAARDRAVRLYTCVEACYPCPRCNDRGTRRDYAGEPWGWVDEGAHICPQCAYDSTKPRAPLILTRRNPPDE